MSKRGKTGAGTHVALRIPWAIHLPTIFTGCLYLHIAATGRVCYFGNK
jgi:hypothetical protein